MVNVFLVILAVLSVGGILDKDVSDKKSYLLTAMFVVTITAFIVFNIN